MAFSFGAPSQPSAASTSNPAPPSGGFSFGNSNNNTAQPSTSNAPSSGGFSFGQQQPQTQQPSGGLSFGQSQTTQQQQPQQQQPSSGGFSFGQPQQSQPQQQQQQQQQNQQQQPTGFSFGQSQSQPQPQPQTQQPTSNPLGQSQFGVSQLGQSNANNNAIADKRLGSSLAPQFESIRQAWDSNNLQTCRFITYFYNNIPPGSLPVSYPPSTLSPFDQNPNFGRRQDAVGPIHEALWSKAVRENPEPSHLVPVLAVGFNDLKARIEAQEAETNRQASHVKTINERITALEQKHTLSDSVRASNALKRQAALHHRVLRITRKSHLLIPSLRGSSISRQEEALRVKLEQCEAELDSNAHTSSGVGAGVDTTGRLRARVNELWAMLGSVKAKREVLERSGRRPATEWAVVDESGVEDVVNVSGSVGVCMVIILQRLIDSLPRLFIHITDPRATTARTQSSHTDTRRRLKGTRCRHAGSQGCTARRRAWWWSNKPQMRQIMNTCIIACSLLDTSMTAFRQLDFLARCRTLDRACAGSVAATGTTSTLAKHRRHGNRLTEVLS